MKKFSVTYLDKSICPSPYISIGVGAEEAVKLANFLRGQAREAVFNCDWDSALLELSAAEKLLAVADELALEEVSE